MSELITPYKLSKSDADHLGGMVFIEDANGFHALDCFKVDADEILKRINSYEQLQTTNKQLLEALERIVSTYQHLNENVASKNHKRPLPIEHQPAAIAKAMEEINNAKQVMGDKG